MCIAGKDGSASGEKRVARRHTWRNELADSFGELADVSTLQASGYQVIHQRLILRQIQEALAIQSSALKAPIKTSEEMTDWAYQETTSQLQFFISSSFGEGIDDILRARTTNVARWFRRAMWAAAANPRLKELNILKS